MKEHKDDNDNEVAKNKKAKKEENPAKKQMT